MKLGIISTVGGSYTWAGSEETWRQLALTALAQGHKVSASLSEGIAGAKQVEALKKAGLNVHPRPELSRVTRRLAVRGFYSRYRNFLSVGHDVVFLSMGGVADIVWIPDLLKALSESKIPLVVFVQANAEGIVSEESQRVVLREFFGRAALVIFLSRHNQRLTERQLACAFPRSEIVMNPLREPVNGPLPWPVTADDGPWLLAEVARLEVTDKQQDHLLEALSTAVWKERNWKLTLFGSGSDEMHIRRLINFYGLETKVVIGGYVQNFQEIWQSHHLHVLPSRREGMPLALIESMACGRPALVTRAGGSPELVEDGVSGFVCPGMHPEVLRESLERAWSHREQWQAMGAAAYSKIEKTVDKQWASNMLSRVLRVAGH